MFIGTVADQRVNPRGLRGSWPAHSQPLIYFLNRNRGVVIQFPVSILFWLSCPKINIGLIPYFEIPLRNFIDAVAIHQMVGKCVDQIIPAVPVRWRRDIALIPEGVKQIAGCQLVGHKTDLHKRPDSICQQTIVNLIDVGEVVDWSPLVILAINAHFVVENGMEANVAEVRDLLHGLQIVAIALTQAQYRPPRTKHLYPKAEKRVSGRRCINYKRIRSIALLGVDIGAISRKCQENSHAEDLPASHRVLT